MKNEKMRPYTVMCTDIYLLIMLVVFPLYYADGYFHLPERKAEFYSIATLIYVIVTLLGAVITAFSMREQWSWEALKKNITGTDICMFGFLISNLIALAMSNDVANSWTGKSSRYYGAKVLILVCVSYFLISRYAWINKVFINAFLIGGNGVCLLATFDYFGMDVLGINKQMQPADWLVFISTMGNANTCASYVCMAVAGAMVYFCVVEGKKSKIFAGVSIVNCSMALIAAKSDSAFVGLAIAIIIITILSWKKKINWQEYVKTLLLVDVGFLLLIIIRNIYINNDGAETPTSGIPRILLNNFNWLIIVFFLLICIVLVLCYVNKRESLVIWINRKQFFVVGILGIIVIVMIYILKIDFLQMFKNGLGIGANKEVGTRIYTYKKVMQAYLEFPIIKKIFGCGQATMTSVLFKYFREELSAAGISINSAHNHILDYLVITGFAGTVCYLGTIVFAVKHAFNILKESKYVLVFGIVVIAYFAQGLFNIEQTATTTVFWLMITCCEAMYRENIVKKSM